MNIIDSLQWRYATKKFDNTKLLAPEKLEVLKEAFNLTATSYGLQPVKLVIVKNKQLQERLVTHSMEQRQVADASHLLVFCIEEIVDAKYIKAYFELVKKVRQTPDEILSSFRDFLESDFKSKTTEEIHSWATKQAYLAMGNLLTVCAIEEIDACPMEGFLPSKYDEILQLKDKGLRSVLVLPIGYRATDDMFSSLKKVRKQLQDSVIEL